MTTYLNILQPTTTVSPTIVKLLKRLQQVDRLDVKVFFDVDFYYSAKYAYLHMQLRMERLKCAVKKNVVYTKLLPLQRYIFWACLRFYFGGCRL